MVNKSPGIDGKLLKRRCIVYDVMEKDISKKKIAEFDSITDAGIFLGIGSGHVGSIIRCKQKHNNIKLGKVITIR